MRYDRSLASAAVAAPRPAPATSPKLRIANLRNNWNRFDSGSPWQVF